MFVSGACDVASDKPRTGKGLASVLSEATSHVCTKKTSGSLYLSYQTASGALTEHSDLQLHPGGFCLKFEFHFIVAHLLPGESNMEHFICFQTEAGASSFTAASVTSSAGAGDRKTDEYTFYSTID